MEVIKDPVISKFLIRFPKDEWNRVILQTLKLGIHSIGTVESLAEINASPRKLMKKLDSEIFHEDDSTDFVPDSLLKVEGTTPSIKEGPKIQKSDSKLPQKKKKTLSQVNKNTISRITPKSKKSKIEFFKETTRIHSLKGKKRQGLKTEPEKKFDLKGNEGIKSSKNLKKKLNDLNSPKNNVIGTGCSKGSLGMIDFSELCKETILNRDKKTAFPLRTPSNNESDLYQYMTSSSDENKD